MSDYQYTGLGYRVDLENREELYNSAQPRSTVFCGDVDPKKMGPSMKSQKILRRENQARMNSCAGNSITTLAEWGLYLQSFGQINEQLSRQFGYVNGQKYAGIGGDNGCTLYGCLQGGQRDGFPRETFAPYTGQYYTRFSQEAYKDAANYKVGAYIPIHDVDDIYEWLAKRMGGAYFGMAWAGQFRNPLPGGLVDEFWDGDSQGNHAVCVPDWCDAEDTPHYLDSEGYPRLKLHNSHGTQYGDDGMSYWSRRAMQQALKARDTVAYFITTMEFAKPRFDMKKAIWIPASVA